MEKVKAYLFARVASSDERDNVLDGQEIELQQYCQEKDYEIVGIAKVQCSGFESSAYLDEILQKADNGMEFQVLLAVSPERFSRNGLSIFEYEQKFQQRGIELETLNGKLHLSEDSEILKFLMGKISDPQEVICECCGQDLRNVSGLR